jgi:hypothetical protein
MALLHSPLVAMPESRLAGREAKEAPLDPDNEHVKALVAARLKTVAERRLIAEALKTDYRRGRSEETLETFVKLQETIEAIDRAIADEERMAKLDAAGTPPRVGFSGL